MIPFQFLPLLSRDRLLSSALAAMSDAFLLTNHYFFCTLVDVCFSLFVSGSQFFQPNRFFFLL
jgi:hypothetical protein